MGKPAFDPNQPFTTVAQDAQPSKPAFDPSQPFEPLAPTEKKGFAVRAGELATKAANYVTKKPTLEGTGEAFKDMVQPTTTMIGEAAGTAGGYPGRILGGGVGSAAGFVGKQMAEGIKTRGMDYVLQPPTLDGIGQAFKDQGNAFLQGTEQVMAGPIIGSALAKTGKALSAGKKAAADAISAAAQRLGFSATPGMTSASPVVQGLESSLSQSPSIAGAMTRSSINPVRKGLQLAAQDAIEGAAENSAYKTGRNVSNGIAGKLGEQYNNIQLAYEPFNKELPKMMPDSEAKWKLADQIAKSGQGNLSLSNDMEGFSRKVSNKVMDSSSLHDIEEIRKQVGHALNSAHRSGDYNAVESLSKMQDHLGEFRDDQFVGLAHQAYPTESGKAMGQQMVGDYQNARSQYKKMMEDLKDVGPLLGIRNKNPQAFIEAVQTIPPEKMTSKLFNTKNYDAVQKVQDYFPEEFDVLKKHKLKEIYDSVLGKDGEIDPAKFVKQADKLSPEIQHVLFGDKVQTIRDMKTVINGLPDKIGPSGTSQGEMYNQSWNPLAQGAEAVRFGGYRTLGSNALQNITQSAQDFGKSPGGQGVAGATVGNLIYSKSALPDVSPIIQPLELRLGSGEFPDNDRAPNSGPLQRRLDKKSQ